MDVSTPLSPDEFATALGVSPKTVRRWIKKGRLPAMQPGGHGTTWLIDASAVDVNCWNNWSTQPTEVTSDQRQTPPDSTVASPQSNIYTPQIEAIAQGEMSPSDKSEKVVAKYFTWRLTRRGRLFYADGRSNQVSPGRFTLDTEDRDEALRILAVRDLEKAVELGLADKSALAEEQPDVLTLEEGQTRFLKHTRRPKVMGGCGESTTKRYFAVFQKAVPFLRDEKKILAWNAVTRRHLEDYAAWLDDEGYAYATEFFEITVLKQAINYWIEEKLLPPICKIKLPMIKPTETDTYCYRPEEVRAMRDLCNENSHLRWLADIITALAATGMRVSELAATRWSDIDLASNTITLTDESRSKRARRPDARSIKNRRGRSFPISDELRTVLERLHADGAEGRVFKAAKGGVLRPDNMRHILINKVIVPLAEKFPSAEEELGFKNGRIHSFRHYFCSTAANSGVPEQMLMRWLGHHSSRMVQRYYHVHDQQAQVQMKKLRFFNGADAS